MTRRLAIVNLSNWPNEMFKVGDKVLAPGEFVEFNDWPHLVEPKVISVSARTDPNADTGYHPWNMMLQRPEEVHHG